MTDLQNPADMLAGAWPGQRMGTPLRPQTPGCWRIPLTKDAVAEARQHVSEMARRALAYSSQIDDVKLMVGELLANAVEHGAGDSVWIRVTANKVTVRVEVRNQGTGFKQPPVPGKPSPDCEYGRGLFLVDALATAWGVTPDTGGTTVWFEVRSP